MPGLARSREKTGNLHSENDPDDLRELVTQVVNVQEASAEELPPTRVGGIEDSQSIPRGPVRPQSEPLVFYVEDRKQKRLRVAAVVLFVMLVGLLMLGNWLYSWEPAASP